MEAKVSAVLKHKSDRGAVVFTRIWCRHLFSQVGNEAPAQEPDTHRHARNL